MPRPGRERTHVPQSGRVPFPAWRGTFQLAAECKSGAIRSSGPDLGLRSRLERSPHWAAGCRDRAGFCTCMSSRLTSHNLMPNEMARTASQKWLTSTWSRWPKALTCRDPGVASFRGCMLRGSQCGGPASVAAPMHSGARVVSRALASPYPPPWVHGRQRGGNRVLPRVTDRGG